MVPWANPSSYLKRDLDRFSHFVGLTVVTDRQTDRQTDTQTTLQLSNKCIAVHKVATATGTHMPHGITQCYLPPGRGDIPALTPTEAGTRLSDPGGMQG